MERGVRFIFLSIVSFLGFKIRRAVLHVFLWFVLWCVCVVCQSSVFYRTHTGL